MYMILDKETGTRTYLKRKASRWHPENYIVATGWKIQGDKQCSWEYHTEPGYQLHIPDNVTCLVGFNIKFDLLWMWDNPSLKAFFKRGGWVWDCQYVEYLIHGQDPDYHYADLSSTAPKYGGTEKIDEVKILWDRGVMTEDIDPNLLIDYLVGNADDEARNGGDIGNTEKVFRGQVSKVKELGMLKAVRSRMDGLCATIEMEWNGLKIDVKEAAKQLKELRLERAELYDKLQTYVPDLPEGLEFNWGSRVHKSCLIFGGTVKYSKKSKYRDKDGNWARLVATEDHYILDDGTTRVVDDDLTGVVLYGSGKHKGLPKTKKVRVPGEIKTKYMDFFFAFPGYHPGDPSWYTKSTDAAGNPLYSTSSETIMSLAGSGVPFCEDLSRYEELNKEITTYFVSKDKDGNMTGMLTCVDPKDKVIHHSLNNVATVTGRLSSSNPNLQNISRGDKSNVKKIFTSRFEGGNMLEADYSQLEVVVQGVLSNDTNLLNDLRNKVDFHCKRIAIQPKYNITYDEVKAIIKDEDHPRHKEMKKIRTNAKIFSFQRAYGAGAALIAASTGMAKAEVEDLIAAEEIEYPGVTAFNDSVYQQVCETAVPFRDHLNDFKIFRKGYWTAPTGCRYSFRSYPAMDYMRERGVEDTFSPTEMKNYPIQGTGGEIVQGICGKLWRHFVSTDNYNNKAVLCNTVHDCVWVDTDSTVTAEVAQDVKRIMESVDEWFRQFGVEITVPFPVEVEVGPNMLELHHFN